MKTLVALCLVLMILASCAPAAGPGGGASYGFVWKGEFAAAPSSPEKSWAYYDTALSQAFYWSGSAWLELRSIPETGAPDIAWIGSLAEAPGQASVNDAYFDRNESRAFIWDGNAWLQLSTLSTSKNAMLSVANGEALVLDHNLNNSELTYNASYRDGTTVRDISWFNAIQEGGRIGAIPPIELLARASDLTPSNYNTDNFSAAVNSFGEILVAYYNGTDTGHGWFKIVDLSGSLKYGPIEFATTRPANAVKVAALPSGNFIIGYMEGTGSLYFSIWTRLGVNALPETVVDSDSVTYWEWDLATLVGGNFAFAMMHNPGADYSGRAEIFTAAGAQVNQYDFESLDFADARDMAIIPLSDGSFYASYKVISSSRHQAVLQHCMTSGPDYGALKYMLEDGEDAWNNYVVTGVTSTADNTAGFFDDGSNSAKFAIDGNFVYGSGALVASETVTAVDLSQYTALVFDMRSDQTWNGNEFQILLDEDGNWGTTDYSFTVVSATNSGAWRRHYIPLPGNRDNLDEVTAIGFKALANKGVCIVWIDNVRLVKGYEPDTTSSYFFSSGAALDATHFVTFGQHSDGSLRYGLYTTVTDGGTGRVTSATVVRDILDPMSPHWMRAATLSHGAICLAYDEDRGYFSFMRLGATGSLEVYRRRLIFDAGGNVNIAAVLPLPKREALIVYRDTWNAVQMKRVGDYSLYVQETSTNQAKLWNFSGQTMTLYLSIDQ